MKIPQIISTTDVSISLKNYMTDHGVQHVIALVDTHTFDFCLPVCQLDTTDLIVIKAGEENKTLDTCVEIAEKLMQFAAGRQAMLLNIGGGVVTDIGGFAASIYKRGIRFINVPTSLLGMVDAAIGGKTGVDHLNYKNLLGTFRQPEAVFIHAGFLDTLPEPEFRSGFSELIKTSVMFDRHLFEMIENGADIGEMITICAGIKQDVTNRDFEDLGERQMLNFGHTIGHAIESLMLERHQPVLHGLAVAEGMLAELRLSLALGLIDRETERRIADLIIRKIGVTFDRMSDWNELLTYMLADKKNVSSEVVFSLPDGIGSGKWGIAVPVNEIIHKLDVK